MTPPDLDAAWEALVEDIYETLDKETFEDVIARHRPIIEAALQQPARSEGLDVERLARALDVDWSPAWHELPIEERSGVGMVEAGWDKRELAVILAREYAALTGSDR